MKYFWILFLLYCIIALIRTPGQGYGAKVLFFFDLFVCALIFRIPDVTISSLTGLALRKPNPPLVAKLISKFCNIFAPNHCENAIAADRARAEATIQLLK